MFPTPFALYNAFSDTGFGGSPAAIIPDAAHIDIESRIRIARELGAPATAFVSHIDAGRVQVQFYSTVAELPMCGHGTVCLITRLVDLGIIELNNSETTRVSLELPSTVAIVEISKRSDDRTLVMLDVTAPRFRQDNIDLPQLSEILGTGIHDYHADLPLETAIGDFIHLVVPLTSLHAIARIKPDFDAIVRFCHRYDIQTIAVFCTETTQQGKHLHVRDFCPAVGVPESAAAGTTNAALSCYLIRHGLASSDNDQPLVIQAEQGIEINRPSLIRTIATMDGDKISRLQVGGVATRVFEGQLYLPTHLAES